MPDWTSAIRARLADLRLDPTRESEIVEELSAHVEDRYRESRGQGASDADATTDALAELADERLLGDLLKSTERRAVTNPPLLGAATRTLGLVGDIRYAARALRRSPAFAVVAVLSLALGSGANAAIFRLLDALRLRHLPVQAPEQLVDIQITDKQGLSGSFGGLHPEFSHPLWERIRERQEGLAGVFAWTNSAFNLADGGQVRNAGPVGER